MPLRRSYFWLILLLPLLLWAELCEVTILQTADTHAEMERWLHLATLIRREYRPKQTLLVDCGDAVQGSLMATITQGEAAMRPLQVLPYNVWVPGNHELDYGYNAYIGFCKSVGDKLLCANFQLPGQARPPAWKLFDVNGARLAVIGMQASFFRNWLVGKTASQFRCEKAREAVARLLPDICAQKPDAIILAIHQGWTESTDKRGVNEVREIAAEFPEIDLILGAHTHRLFPGQKVGLKSWYVQPGAHAQYLTVVKLTVDTEAHSVVDIQSSLKAVTPDLPVDEELAKELAPFFKQLKEFNEKPLGIVLEKEITANGRPGVSCQTSDLIAQAIAEAVGADTAFHSRLTESPLPAGEIRQQHLFELIPYENKIVSALFSAEQLERLMEEQWALRNNPYRYSGPWNMLFRNNGGKMTLVSINGEPPVPDRRYRVAFNSHTAAGSGNLPLLKQLIEAPEAQLSVTRINTRRATELFLRAHQNTIQFKQWVY